MSLRRREFDPTRAARTLRTGIADGHPPRHRAHRSGAAPAAAGLI
jgi:hypothetical protein